MKLIIEETPKSVVVITPTIGKPTLADAIESVRKQTYENVTHLIVWDGKHPVGDMMIHPKTQVCVLPQNTGSTGGKFYGHRVYAGFSHLVNQDYVLFLDEDNWYEPNHVTTMVEQLDQGCDFTYSLRNIYSENKQFICQDDCKSLGPKHPIYFTRELPKEQSFLIDTSCWGFKREFLIHYGHIWHSGWGGDRTFLNYLRQFVDPQQRIIDTLKYSGTGRYTLNYRLDGNPNSVKPEFFIQGNEYYRQLYEILRQEFPWRISG